MEDTQATHAGRGQQVERMKLIVCALGGRWRACSSGGGGGFGRMGVGGDAKQQS